MGSNATFSSSQFEADFHDTSDESSSRADTSMESNHRGFVVGYDLPSRCESRAPDEGYYTTDNDASLSIAGSDDTFVMHTHVEPTSFTGRRLPHDEVQYNMRPSNLMGSPACDRSLPLFTGRRAQRTLRGCMALPGMGNVQESVVLRQYRPLPQWGYYDQNDYYK